LIPSNGEEEREGGKIRGRRRTKRRRKMGMR
jgi:hypothetical protein